MRKVFRSKEGIILLVLLALMILITSINGVFIRLDNIVDMIKGSVVIGIMAMGMLVVMLTGGIDVSVGSSISAISFVVGYFWVNVTQNILLAFILSAVLGMGIGVINYLLIVRLKIPPIVATLGTMSIISGLLLYFTIGNRINILPDSILRFSESVLLTINTKNAGLVKIPIQFLFLLGAILVTWFILKYTVIGRGIYTIGGNIVFAERIGFNIKKIQLFAYTFLGFMVGIASIVGVTINKQVDPSSYFGFELQVVAVVILGGASVEGGNGSVAGTVLGVMLMAVIKNGLILTRMPTFWHDIILGAVIILAITLNAVRNSRYERNLIKVDLQ